MVRYEPSRAEPSRAEPGWAELGWAEPRGRAGRGGSRFPSVAICIMHTAADRVCLYIDTGGCCRWGGGGWQMFKRPRSFVQEMTASYHSTYQPINQPEKGRP